MAKRALVSVSDKTGLVDFVSGLQAAGWEIIATGGTQKLLENSGIKTIGISDVTGFPEICDGRVKTLHPKVHGGLLARRDEPSHLQALEENGISFIDLVCEKTTVYLWVKGFNASVADLRETCHLANTNSFDA